MRRLCFLVLPIDDLWQGTAQLCEVREDEFPHLDLPGEDFVLDEDALKPASDVGRGEGSAGIELY